MFVFLFIAPPTTDIYTLSLHDALPISHQESINGSSVPVPRRSQPVVVVPRPIGAPESRVRVPAAPLGPAPLDRKSTRLNSSHSSISYAVFCLKKKNKDHASTHDTARQR